MPLISCEIWSAVCVIVETDRATTFEITNTELYVALVTLSLLQQLKSRFKQTVN